MMKTWKSHTALCVLMRSQSEVKSGFIRRMPLESKLFSFCITGIEHCQVCSSAETGRRRFRSPPRPDLWAWPHVPTQVSPGAETHPAQQTFFSPSFYMEFITNGYSSSPQSPPHPSSGLCSSRTERFI